MHIPFNTQGGLYGFRVTLTDGQIFAENKYTWDEVPRDGTIKLFELVHFPTNYTFVKLSGYDRYFFSNGASNLRPDPGSAASLVQHKGKVFGGGNATRSVKASFSLNECKPRSEEVATESLGFAESVYRQGG